MDQSRARFTSTTAIFLLAILAVSGCGETRTTGFFAGLSTSTSPTVTVDEEGTAVPVDVTIIPDFEDTLLNCTFDNVLAEPFGPLCQYEVYNGAMHIDNSVFATPVVMLSTSGLLDDGIVEAQFDLIDAAAHSVVGVAVGALSTEDFILLGVNSRGQYTVQQCINGLWLPVMGLDVFESSRLLPFSLPGVIVSGEVHDNYIDLRVNGQLIQVIRTSMPAMGQVGVFVDAYTEADLDRFTVIPSE